MVHLLIKSLRHLRGAANNSRRGRVCQVSDGGESDFRTVRGPILADEAVPPGGVVGQFETLTRTHKQTDPMPRDGLIRHFCERTLLWKGGHFGGLIQPHFQEQNEKNGYSRKALLRQCFASFAGAWDSGP